MIKLKKYWIEIILIISYLIADNLHMVVEYYNYSPNWYMSPWANYKFNDSIFFLFHYFGSAPLIITFVLFYTLRYEKNKDINKAWMRLCLLFVSTCDFIGELSETFNLKFTLFSNEGYTHFTIVKILLLLISPLFVFKMKKVKKMCMKLLKLFAYG